MGLNTNFYKGVVLNKHFLEKPLINILEMLDANDSIVMISLVLLSNLCELIYTRYLFLNLNLVFILFSIYFVLMLQQFWLFIC